MFGTAARDEGDGLQKCCKLPVESDNERNQTGGVPTQFAPTFSYCRCPFFRRPSLTLILVYYALLRHCFHFYTLPLQQVYELLCGPSWFLISLSVCFVLSLERHLILPNPQKVSCSIRGSVFILSLSFYFDTIIGRS